ncbi:MAG: T9SS type A sorting domain-containing protein, partial [Bacteroidetes bacterium]|nr:T9SS type A sorting domain-containing protein [Bacteroidota bacterium]
TGEFVLSLKVTDPNGCTGFNFTNIYVHPVPVFSIDTESNNTCVGGEAALSISSLPDNYTIAWTVNGGSLDNPASPNPVFTSGISGTFVVSANIVNEFGCEGFATTSITVSEAATCEATITSDYNGLAISSWGGSDGSASATASGGTPPYSFDWSNNVDGPYNTNLSAGTYTVVITDSLGCSCESSVTLINPSKLGDLAWKDINGNGLQDENEPGMPDVQVILSGMNSLGNPVNDTTVTDESGMYMFDGLHPGTYKLTFESLTEHPFTQVNTGENDQIDSDVDPDMGMTGNIELGQGEYNATIDAGYLSSSIRIGDFVWHDINKNGIQDIDEPGVADFMVKLITPGADDIFDTSDDVIIPTITDTDGKYFFDVLPGKYIIEFMPSSLPDGWDFTLMDQGDTDTNDSDADNVSGRISMFVIEDEQEDDFSFDAGIHSLCDNLTDPGIIGGDEILCAGEDPTPITNLAFPSGGSGEIEYLWMRSYIVGPFDQFTWQLIPGATEPSYDPGPLYQTTSFIRCARRVGCELFVEPTPVVKTVVPGPDQSTVSGPIELCVGEEGDYSVLIEEIGTITYDWNFGEDAEPETATIQSVTNVSWSSPGVKTVTLSINHLDCFYSYSFEVTVLDCPTILGLFGELSGIPTPTNEVALKWTMKQEPIESNFVVERANADRDKFYTIGVVTGNGGAEQSTYTYIDSKPFLGNNYYRIKHFDNSNNYMYSDEIEILMQPDGINNILMYPNPFEHTINIQIIRPLEEQATIELVDVYGKILQTIHLPMGKFNHQLDLSHLPNGMYFAYICYDGYRKLTEKILKKE